MRFSIWKREGDRAMQGETVNMKSMFDRILEEERAPLLKELKKARKELDKAVAERDKAAAELDKAVAEWDEILVKWDKDAVEYCKLADECYEIASKNAVLIMDQDQVAAELDDARRTIMEMKEAIAQTTSNLRFCRLRFDFGHAESTQTQPVISSAV